MKKLLFGLWWAWLLGAGGSKAHEIEGLFIRNQSTSRMDRAVIPFSSFKKTETGRLYTLWIAPDGALAFEMERAWDKQMFSAQIPHPKFRVWIVTAKTDLVLPKGFEDMSADSRGKMDEAEEMVGTAVIRWRNDADYSIRLDVRGEKGRFGFSGHVYGNGRNRPVSGSASEVSRDTDGEGLPTPAPER